MDIIVVDIVDKVDKWWTADMDGGKRMLKKQGLTGFLWKNK